MKKKETFARSCKQTLISRKHAEISSSYFSRAESLQRKKSVFHSRDYLLEANFSTPSDDVTFMCSQFYSRRFFVVSISIKTRKESKERREIFVA